MEKFFIFDRTNGKKGISWHVYSGDRIMYSTQDKLEDDTTIILDKSPDFVNIELALKS